MDDMVEALLDENENLRERIRQLEEVLCPTIDVPVEYGLTATEMRLFSHLLTKPLVTKRGLHAAAYGDWIDETPDETVIESHVCKLRRKIKKYGFQIKNERFAGYRLSGPRQLFEVHHG